MPSEETTEDSRERLKVATQHLAEPLPRLPHRGHMCSAHLSIPEVGLVKCTRLMKPGSKETLGFFKDELFTSAQLLSFPEKDSKLSTFF